MLELLDLDPRGVYGWNTIRGDIGGLLIGSALMILVGLWSKNTTWFLSTILTMAALLVGRFISFVADGFTTAAFPAIIVEIVVILIMLAAHRKLDPTKG